jgi:hypothetical protein
MRPTSVCGLRARHSLSRGPCSVPRQGRWLAFSCQSVLDVYRRRLGNSTGGRPGGQNLDGEGPPQNAVELRPGYRDDPRPLGPGSRSPSRLVPKTAINLDPDPTRDVGVEVGPGWPRVWSSSHEAAHGHRVPQWRPPRPSATHSEQRGAREFLARTSPAVRSCSGEANHPSGSPRQGRTKTYAGLRSNSTALERLSDLTQLVTLDLDFFTERAGRIPVGLMAQVDAGLTLVLDL